MRSAALLTVVGLSLIAVATAAPSGGPGVHAQATTSVEVGDSWFCDPGDTACMTTDSDDVDVATSISAGDTVTWSWVGALPHTTTACSGSDFATCDGSQGWDSGIQSSGSFSFTFDTAGIFYYRCNVHPSEMRGTVTVLAAAEPSPSPEPTQQPEQQAAPDAATPTPTPTAVQPTAVPVGGGAPPADGDSPSLWWVAVAAGGLFLASAAVIGLRGLRR